MKLGSTQGSMCRNSHLLCLIIHLEENLDRPVIDETNFTGQYDWDTQWVAGTSPALIAGTVRDQLGLVLTLLRRSVKMLILEKKK